jgi:hypothetical protein
MRHLDRILIGFLLVLVSGFVLWYGSPLRRPLAPPDTLYPAAFVTLFALGFIVAGVGLLGFESDYPAFLSTSVLYFLVGGLLAVVIFIRQEGVGLYTLDDANTAGFWTHWVRIAVMWPFELVRMADFLSYGDVRLSR